MPHRQHFTHRSSLAAEDVAVYEEATALDPTEAPAALRELLDATATADRALARAVTLLVRTQATGEVEAETGLPVEAWLSQLGRMLRVDRTFLTVAATCDPA